MSDLDEARERLRSDEDFRAKVVVDPAGALADYQLTGSDLLVLADELDLRDGAPVTVRSILVGDDDPTSPTVEGDPPSDY